MQEVVKMRSRGQEMQKIPKISNLIYEDSNLILIMGVHTFLLIMSHALMPLNSYPNQYWLFLALVTS